MSQSSARSRVVTVPNMVTLLGRIVPAPLVPVILWHKESVTEYTGWDAHYLAFAVVIIALLTDAIDGPLARALNQVSVWGARLDPWSDGILTTCLISAVYVNAAFSWYSIICYGPATITLIALALHVGYLRKVYHLDFANQEAKLRQVYLSIALGALFLEMLFQNRTIVWSLETVGIVCGYHAVFLSKLSLEEFQRKAALRR